MPMIPVRKPYGGGAGMQASAAGGPSAPGMTAAAPQLGRMPAPPSMPMGGQGQELMPPVPAPSVPGMPIGDPGGGPMAPQNIGSMLTPAQPPPQQPQGQQPAAPLRPWGQDQYGQGGGEGFGTGGGGGGGGEAGGAGGAGGNVGAVGGDGTQIPMIMLKLMQMLGHI